MTWYSFYTILDLFYPRDGQGSKVDCSQIADIKRLVKRVTTLVSKVPWGRVSEIIAVEGGKPDPSQRGKIGESEQTV